MLCRRMDFIVSMKKNSTSISIIITDVSQNNWLSTEGIYSNSHKVPVDCLCVYNCIEMVAGDKK